MPGVFGRGVESIGRGINTIMHGRNLHPMVRAGMSGVSMSASRMAGMRNALISEAGLKTGRRAVGGAIAATSLGIANRRGSGARGGYQPRRPVIQGPQNGMPM